MPFTTFAWGEDVDLAGADGGLTAMPGGRASPNPLRGKDLRRGVVLSDKRSDQRTHKRDFHFPLSPFKVERLNALWSFYSGKIL